MEHDLFRKPVSTFRDHALAGAPNPCSVLHRVFHEAEIAAFGVRKAGELAV
jgi:hypothetical protein